MDKDLNFQNILVIDFGQLGDVVMSLPALKAIRNKFPAAHIAVLTGMAAGEVVEISSLANEVIRVDRVELRDGPKLRSIGKILEFVSGIRHRKIDLVIDLHSLSETNILAFLSKAKYRLLANRESRSLDVLSNFRPSPPKEDKHKHLCDRYLDVLLPLGITNAERSFLFPISPGDADYVANKFFADVSGQMIGLFPGAGHPSRCWALGKFAELAAKCELSGLTPVVFLGPEEKEMRKQVVATFPGSTIVVDGLSIAQFVAAASCLAAFVTNDTGPMHLVACTHVPILLLLDKRAPTTYMPLAEKLERIHDKTINEISVDETFIAMGRLLKSAGLENDKSAATC